MKELMHVLEHSLIDSLKILPILLVVYLLIEFFEYKGSSKFANNKFLNKKSSSVFGALLGSVPQCGFSVIATDLYTKRKINVGALIAVYIATSDEAIPIMLSDFKSLKAVLPLILVKIVIAIIVGFVAQILFDKIFSKQNTIININTNNKHVETHEHNHEHPQEENEKSEHKEEHEHENNLDVKQKQLKSETSHHGCCHHDIEHKKYDWKHPIMHCVKIFITILIINIIFGCIIEFGFKGEENLSNFLSKNGVFAIQPMLAMLIGFIPNCASSVVLTELYLIDGLSFGALVAGLIVNAGIGLILLLKNNKRLKENIFIILTLVVTSLVFGYLLHFIV